MVRPDRSILVTVMTDIVPDQSPGMARLWTLPVPGYSPAFHETLCPAPLIDAQSGERLPLPF